MSYLPLLLLFALLHYLQHHHYRKSNVYVFIQCLEMCLLSTSFFPVHNQYWKSGVVASLKPFPHYITFVASPYYIKTSASNIFESVFLIPLRFITFTQKLNCSVSCFSICSLLCYIMIFFVHKPESKFNLPFLHFLFLSPTYRVR